MSANATAGLGRLLLLGRLVDERLVDVRDHAAARDRGLDERVELLVAADGELEVARRDALHLEVLAGVARELEHLGREVLEDGGRVHGGRRADALRGRHAELEEAVEPTDRELEARLERLGLGRLLGRGGLAALAALAAFASFARHGCCCELAAVGRVVGEWTSKRERRLLLVSFLAQFFLFHQRFWHKKP